MVRPNIPTARHCSIQASSLLAHATLTIFIKLLAKYYTYNSCITKQSINFPVINMNMWWAMEPWYELGGDSIAP
jgi:hypothetical protein